MMHQSVVALFIMTWGLGSPSLAQRLPDVTVAAGSWDWRGYVPLEATGPLPEPLREAVRYLRANQAQRAMPLLREFHRKNPRDYRGINALIQGARMTGEAEAFYREYRSRVLRPETRLQDRYGFILCGYAIGPERNLRDGLLFLQQAGYLWDHRQGNLGPTIAVTFIVDEDVTFWTWRARMDQFVRENPKNASLALLRGINYASGYSNIMVVNDPKSGKATPTKSVLTEPKYEMALEIFRRIQRENRDWAMPVFQEARCLALLNRPQDAVAAFRRYLEFQPPADSRQARKARAYIARPNRQSLWLPEELEAAGVKPRN